MTHVDTSEGESRLDKLLYSAHHVIYLEAIMENFRSAKLPTLEDNEGRAAKIISSLQKWLGDDVYNVELNEDGSQLTATHRHGYTSRVQHDQTRRLSIMLSLQRAPVP